MVKSSCSFLGELTFAEGDLIGFGVNLNNGYSVGFHEKRGTYPSYKAEVDTPIVDFPTYANVSN